MSNTICPDRNLLIDRNGTIPVAAASLTKAAISLAAIKTWELGQIAKLRQQQDTLLQSLLKEWGQVTPTPLVVTKHDRDPAYFGDLDRNIAIMSKSR